MRATHFYLHVRENICQSYIHEHLYIFVQKDKDTHIFVARFIGYVYLNVQVGLYMCTSWHLHLLSRIGRMSDACSAICMGQGQLQLKGVMQHQNLKLQIFTTICEADFNITNISLGIFRKDKFKLYNF